MLGYFNVELTFFGAIGTYISDSGLEYLLSEAGILAEGSVVGFIKGKFYNRCTRIHQIAAAVLERSLFERYLSDTLIADKYQSILQEINRLSSDDTTSHQFLAESEEFKNLLEDYEQFFHEVMNGKYGKTAAYWAIYIYFINR